MKSNLFNSKLLIVILSVYSLSFSQILNKNEIISIGLEISILEEINQKKDSINFISATVTYDFDVSDSIRSIFIKNIEVDKLLKKDELTGCLDGLGSDVSFILFMKDETRSEIFFGCDNYTFGTLRKGNDYSNFWKININRKYQNELKQYIMKRKDKIHKIKLKEE